MAVGRITGPLLKANLLRDGVDLAFETDLLYLDVQGNGRIGIKTTNPQHELDVSGTTRTTNLIVDTQADLATFTFNGNTLSSTSGTINLVPNESDPQNPDPIIYQGKIVTGNLQLSTNTIETTGTNTDLVIQTTGLGVINVNSNMWVDGNIHATGNITADGDIVIGDANTDNVTFNAEIASDIIPNNLLGTPVHDLGSNPDTGGQEWANAYINSVYATNITADNVTVSGIDLTLPQGNIVYVSKNGSDTNAGVHENNPVATIKHALTLASSGTTVFIYPGTYTEIFPLTIPVGVTVKGAGVRAVTIQPTVGTVDYDAILLNGETTVEELSIANFRFNGTNNTGYGFRFANDFLVTSRSPYIRNVSVITRGSVTSSLDPYGFDSDDAGKGVLLDGSVANASSNEASCLFHGVTFITPNQETITATNGVRIEWLNSFTYFADKGFNLLSGSTGFAGNGLTRLRINDHTGTWAVGNTVRYYDTDGITVLASGTIDSIVDSYINLTGKCVGFQPVTDRAGKTVYAQGTAKLTTSLKKWGTASLALSNTIGSGAASAYTTVPVTTDFQFGTTDFTIEGWIYKLPGTGVNQILTDQRISASSDIAPVMLIGSGNQLVYSVAASNRITGTTVITDSAWHHIAISRHNGVTKMYLDGVQEGSNYADTNNYVTGPLVIGARFNFTFGFDGYIDDLRIEKGVAKYTGSSFTVPTQALSSDNNTVLMLHFNGANDSVIFLDDGYTQQDVRTDAGGRASVIDFADYSDFGVEVRSIGSANIYGNYGVHGDGEGVIAYLISQNFAYIGSGKKSNNDPNDKIEANEVVELNGAHVYFTYVDNEGDFNVGNKFHVNQKTGEVTFNGQSLNVTSLEGVTFTDGVNTTTITSTDITTGNIRIHDNNVDSLTGDVIVTAASGAINLQNNTFVTGNLDVTGDVTIGGNIQIGDETTDTINFVGGINSNLVPATTSLYNLGSDTPDARWNNVYLSRAEIDGLVIDSNTISTTIGNDDLQLTANGAGRIYVPSNNVQIDQNLTVNGTSYIDTLSVTHTITSDIFTTGDIEINDNYITTTVGSHDLRLLANNTGRIYVPSNNVQIDQTLTVDGLTTLKDVSITGDVTQLGNITQTGDVTQTGDYHLTGNLTVDGLTAQFEDIKLYGNLLTTTLSNSDLDIIANGSGKVYIPSNNVQIDQSLTVTTDLTVTTGNTYLKNVGVTGTITQTGDIHQTGTFTTSGNTDVTGNVTVSGYLELPVIKLDGNQIYTKTTGTDLILEANGSGNVVFEGLKVQDNNIQSTVTNSNIVLTPQGTGTVVINSTQSLQIPVGTTAERPGAGVRTLGMIRYNTDLQQYEGWNGTYWLKMNGVQDLDGNTYITAELTPGTNDNTIRFYADNNLMVTIDSTKLFAERLHTNNLDIYDNTITTLVTDTDIVLATPGAGGVKVGNLRIRNNTITNVVAGAVTEFAENSGGYVKIAGTNGVVIPAGDTEFDRPPVPELGMMRFNTVLQVVEIYNGVTWTSVAGTSAGITAAEATELGIVTALLFG